MSKKSFFEPSFRESFDGVQKEKNGHSYPSIDQEEEMMYEDENFGLTDALDHEILMHRDAHFNGDFEVMLDYYQDDRIGVNPDFSVDRIQYLAEVEIQMGQNLAPILLKGAEAERVAKARKAYRQIKELYETEEDSSSYPRLIADLILSEEEEPESEIEAVVNCGKGIVPSLLQIIKSADAYDDLYPGYGYAPYLATVCLGRIKDPRSIIPLFEMLNQETVFGEEVVLDAFSQIGESAKSFLLKTLASRPITRDNVNAAFALTGFIADEEIAVAAFQQLQDAEVRVKPLLTTYLLCLCDPLQNTIYREPFENLSQDPLLSKDLQKEIKKICEEWK